MGYYVKALPHKKSEPKWKIQFVSWRKDYTSNSNAAKPKKEWDLPKKRLTSLGFNSSMSIDSAIVRAKQLNAQLAVSQREERLCAIDRERR